MKPEQADRSGAKDVKKRFTIRPYPLLRGAYPYRVNVGTRLKVKEIDVLLALFFLAFLFLAPRVRE